MCKAMGERTKKEQTNESTYERTNAWMNGKNNRQLKINHCFVCGKSGDSAKIKCAISLGVNSSRVLHWKCREKTRDTQKKYKPPSPPLTITTITTTTMLTAQVFTIYMIYPWFFFLNKIIAETWFAVDFVRSTFLARNAIFASFWSRKCCAAMHFLFCFGNGFPFVGRAFCLLLLMMFFLFIFYVRFKLHKKCRFARFCAVTFAIVCISVFWLLYLFTWEFV